MRFIYCIILLFTSTFSVADCLVDNLKTVDDLKQTLTCLQRTINELKTEKNSTLEKPIHVIENLHPIGSNNVLRVAMATDSPPMYFRDESGNLTGFDYEFISALAKNMGYQQFKVVESKYSELPDFVTEGKADVFLTGFIPSSDIKGISWSDGYLDFGLCLAIRKNESHVIRTVAQLTGKKIGIYKDPAVVSWVKSNIRSPSSITQFEYVGWFNELMQKNVDAIIYDYPFATVEIQPFPALKIVALNLNEMHYSIGVAESNIPLLNQINQAIRQFTQTNEYSDLLKKYFQLKDKIDTSWSNKSAKTYIVKYQDTLSKIAQKKLGNMHRWTSIWELNKNRIPNPHLISEGDMLKMPED